MMVKMATNVIKSACATSRNHKLYSPNGATSFRLPNSARP